MKYALARRPKFPPAVFRIEWMPPELDIISKGTITEMLDLLNRWQEQCTIEEPTDKDYTIVTILEDKAKEFKKALQDDL